MTKENVSLFRGDSWQDTVPIEALTNYSLKVGRVRSYYPIEYERFYGALTGYAVRTFRMVAELLNRTLEVVQVEYGKLSFRSFFLAKPRTWKFNAL